MIGLFLLRVERPEQPCFRQDRDPAPRDVRDGLRRALNAALNADTLLFETEEQTVPRKSEQLCRAFGSDRAVQLADPAENGDGIKVEIASVYSEHLRKNGEQLGMYPAADHIVRGNAKLVQSGRPPVRHCLFHAREKQIRKGIRPCSADTQTCFERL